MRRIIFALILSLSTTATFAQGAPATSPPPTVAGKPIELAPDAPERHIVVPSDTLWGISSKFLKDPYRWPDLWKMNTEQVKNPHRIYPGQVLILDRSGAEPQLKLAKLVKLEPQVRVATLSKEIPAIPPQAIEPFLSQPLIIETGELDNAPRIVATHESRVYTAAGDTIFAAGVDPKVKLWQIYRPAVKPLIDPDSGEAIGIEAIYLGSARLAQNQGEGGNVQSLVVTEVKQEIGRGDYLVPASSPEVMSYMPHPPEQRIDGRVLALYGGVGEGGRYSIVSLSRGKRNGLEMGHVLALARAGVTVTNRFDDNAPESHVLPDERYGLMFVFRVFDRISYALIINAERSVMPGDRVREP